MIRAHCLPEGASIWNPYGDDPGILTGVTVTNPDDDGMVALAAAELDEPLQIASDWPVPLAH